MQILVYFSIVPWGIHRHILFESLGMAIAAGLSLQNVRKDTISPNQCSSVEYIIEAV